MPYIYFASYEGKTLLSRMIKWRTWSRKSHSAIFRPDLETVIEAWRKGVVRRHWTEGHAPGTVIDIYRVPCTAQQGAEFYLRANSYVGKKYDFGAIIGFALRVKTASSKSLFCSEMVFQCFADVGINLLARIEPAKVDPGRLDTTPLAEHIERRIISDSI